MKPTKKAEQAKDGVIPVAQYEIHAIRERAHHSVINPSTAGPRRFIKPGEFFFGESDDQIHTLLGSCIAIVLWHPVLHIGGMCHFVLPERIGPHAVGQSASTFDGHYADGAMALFEREATRRGTDLKEYQAKIFGGSYMQASLTLVEDERIGTKNIKAVLKHLRSKEIPILAAHVGEMGYRRIGFNVKSGNVWVKHQAFRNGQQQCNSC